MRRPLRIQILLPTAGLLIAAVCINAAFAALWASYRAGQETTERLQQVAQVLAETSFPRSPAVLGKLRQLTGADFAVWSVPAQQVTASTYPDSEAAALQQELQRLVHQAQSGSASITLSGRRYRASRIESAGTGGREWLWLLVPEGTLVADRWGAAVPALLVGLTSLAVLIPVVLQLAARLGRRIASVQRQVTAVAEGRYEPIVAPAHVDDEIHQLLEAVNELTARLRELQSRIVETERTRLLGQFAGGLAHQLRNAITGAKLAVQLHERRCAIAATDTSLKMALKQLALTEQQLKGLLSLGRQQPSTRTPCFPVEVSQSVLELVTMTAEHLGVALAFTESPPIPQLLLDRESVLAAILNLLLNGLEAAGRGGSVSMQVLEQSDRIVWTISDSGQGPNDATADRMFEPFVTTKPEGVGLGLALARQVANDHQGTLDWSRGNGRTTFRLTIPRQQSGG
ncbi:MAG: ATP-binding protein [Planctomycetaceae bacterium]|nr:ATP-binding protein [Planctomycetaceae bacterium]